MVNNNKNVFKRSNMYFFPKSTFRIPIAIIDIFPNPGQIASYIQIFHKKILLFKNVLLH